MENSRISLLARRREIRSSSGSSSFCRVFLIMAEASSPVILFPLSVHFFTPNCLLKSISEYTALPYNTQYRLTGMVKCGKRGQLLPPYK